MKPDEIDDEQLLYLVGTTDKEMFDAGMDITRRDWEVPNAIMRKFGYVGFFLGGAETPKIYKRIRSTFASIYRKQDIAMGGHIGVFMYRDVFARIGVPTLFGRVGINPFRFVELTPVQLRIIQSEPDQVGAYLDQFCDVADVQYGIEEMKKPFAATELVVRFIGLSRLHLHSAAAVLTGGYDHRGAVQAALLASELGLKAGAAAQGLSEQDIKDRFGHRNSVTADFVGENWPSFDLERVKRVIAKQPPYVPNRYSAEQPDRREVGHLVMGAQYIVSEIARQMSDRDFRTCVEPPMTRCYPA